MLNPMQKQVHDAAYETPEQIFTRVFRDLHPRTKLGEVKIEFRRYANANSFIVMTGDRLEIRIADILEGAPIAVLEALAHILISKLYRRPIPAMYSHRYRLHLNRKDVRRDLHLLRQIRGRKFLSNPTGQHYDLAAIFEDLNQRFFHGLMARPLLGWSRRKSRTMLGHFDPAHNAIVISKLLDSRYVPKLAVEYVVFHEMLHLLHPVQHNGSRRRVHTREFREAEKAFPELSKAKALLRSL